MRESGKKKVRGGHIRVHASAPHKTPHLCVRALKKLEVHVAAAVCRQGDAAAVGTLGAEVVHRVTELEGMAEEGDRVHIVGGDQAVLVHIEACGGRDSCVGMGLPTVNGGVDVCAPTHTRTHTHTCAHVH